MGDVKKTKKTTKKKTKPKKKIQNIKQELTPEQKLTEKQRRFIDFYIETGNSAEASRLAGYRGTSHDAIGGENLRKLRKFIDVKLKEKSDARIASQDEVLYYLTSVLRGEIKEECIVVESQGMDCGSIAVIKNKQVTPKDRNDAAKQLAKIFGMNSKIEIARLEIEKEKLELAKIKINPVTEEIEDDGFIEALKHEGKSIWEGEQIDVTEST